MRRSLPWLFALVMLAGCTTAAQTSVATPHVHRPVNTIRPGNGVGNALALPLFDEREWPQEQEGSEPFSWAPEDLGWAAAAAPLAEREPSPAARAQLASAPAASSASTTSSSWEEIPWQDSEEGSGYGEP